MINPHFDHQRVIWSDDYSGQYGPIAYDAEFDGQWRLFLEGRQGFTAHTGVETSDAWIDDRIFDLTGHRGVLVPGQDAAGRDMGGRQRLDLRFGRDFFAGKRCIDIACGAGRWTRALQALDGDVTSIDVSEHGLASVRRFNRNVARVDLFDLVHRSDFHDRFDFALAWGVLMSTHDPALAFANVARTVRPGGSLYVMVYAPTYHNSPAVLQHRAHYHRTLRSTDERLRYAYDIADAPGNVINYLDMLNPFYNWVIPEPTIHGWFARHGFTSVVTLNASEPEPVAYHVCGVKRPHALPFHDDAGARVPQPAPLDDSTRCPLAPPFLHESGMAWQATLPALADRADDLHAPHRSTLVLLEDGRPLWLRHAMHDDVRRHGGGAYSHWRDRLILSTTDNSDPNTNGRRYEIAFTK